MSRLLSNRKLRWTCSVLAALVSLWAVLQFTPPRGAVPGPNPFCARVDGRPLVIAHAGGLGLHPENTLEAFAASAALHCDMLEMDVRLCKDGVLVTHHDATVTRTSNGTGAVAEHTLAELKALNFGHHFRDAAGGQPYRERPARLATLEEVFQHHGSLPMTIELKDRGELGRRAGEALAALIPQYQMTHRVIVACFDDATLGAFRSVAGHEVATSSARGETRRFVLLRRLRLDRLWRGGVAAVQVPSDPREASGFALARPDFIHAAHARNMAVHYWTVNDPEEMRRLIELGADGLMTDFPDRMQRVFGQMRR